MMLKLVKFYVCLMIMEDIFKMVLDAVVVLTLEREERRKWIATGGLWACGVPHHLVFYEIGDDARDYSGTVSVLEAAIDDGFPKFGECLSDGSHENLSHPLVAQFWSYLRICRRAVEDGHIYLWIQDCRYLNRDWEDCVEMVHSIDDLFFCVLGEIKEGFFVEDLKSLDILDYKIPVCQGLYSSFDAGVIVAPKGAQWLIENAKPGGYGTFLPEHNIELPAWGCFETYLHRLCQDPSFNFDGVYTTFEGIVVEHPYSYIGSTISDANEKPLHKSFKDGGPK